MKHRRVWRAAAGVWLAVALAPVLAAEPAVALRLPVATELPWRGVPAAEAAGNAGAILYPAVGGLAGMLAAVFTHGAVVEGSRSAERSKQQQLADQVLEPYRATLASWTPRALFEASAGQLPGLAVRVLDNGVEAASGDWLVEMAPSFALTPDQATLILDNAIRVTRTGAGELPRFEGTVRVLSTPLAVAPQEHWPAAEAKALKDETAAMVAHTVQLALAQARAVAAPEAAAPAPFRTHRYLMGAEERSERSQLVARGCARSVLRTLRGHLLSVATRPEPGQPPCARPYELKD